MSITGQEIGKPPRRVESCPACGAPVRVRQDGCYAVHTAGQSNSRGYNWRCAGSERNCEQPA